MRWTSNAYLLLLSGHHMLGLEDAPKMRNIMGQAIGTITGDFCNLDVSCGRDGADCTMGKKVMGKSRFC